MTTRLYFNLLTEIKENEIIPIFRLLQFISIDNLEKQTIAGKVTSSINLSHFYQISR